MKINYTKDGLEDLTGYVYNYKNNLFTRDGNDFSFLLCCAYCKQSFMGEVEGTGTFCDRDCRGAYIFLHSFSSFM